MGLVDLFPNVVASGAPVGIATSPEQRGAR